MIVRDGLVALQIDGRRAQHMGGAASDQGLVALAFEQGLDCLTPLVLAEATHFVDAIRRPQGRRSRTITGIGQWSVARDQVAYGLPVLQRGEPGRAICQSRTTLHSGTGCSLASIQRHKPVPWRWPARSIQLP